MNTVSAQQSDPDPDASRNGPTGRRLALLALGALGVVYGDIGTSPLYTIRSCFHGAGLEVTPANLLGVLSLILWALIVVICIKYQLWVMRADNKGEGGILALLALLDPWGKTGSRRATIWIVLGVFGSALLYGDGVITPAISVLSAVEGLEVAAPVLERYVVPLTIAILIVLFAVQRKGTGKVGVVFGPVTALWFLTIGGLGIKGILMNPQVLAAANPMYALEFLLHHGSVGLIVLGAVFLAVTGGEALYADLGHFGRRPIRLAWFSFVLPALLLNYFGQGAEMMLNPANIANPFYTLAPRWMLYPLIILATAATVIASQAVISGAFSLMSQAIQFGQSPRLKIVQTSADERGQVYIPMLNWMLMLTTIGVVLGFKHSEDLAAAYGIAVSTTMVITTVLMFAMVRQRWHWPLPVALLVAGIFLIVDVAFFSANVLKFADGGWLPLSIAGFAYLIMSTWATGRSNLIERLRKGTENWASFATRIQENPPPRVDGTSVFMTAPNLGMPPALQHHLEHNRSLHERVILLTVLTDDVPRVPIQDRLEVEPLGLGFYHVKAHFGFMQTPNVSLALRKLIDFDMEVEMDKTTFYIGRETLLPTRKVPGMMKWREKLFAFMQRNALRATDFYGIPPERTVELGIRLSI